MSKPQAPQPLLSLRAAVLLLMTAVVGVAAAGLLTASGRPLAEAVIGGFVAAAGSLPLFMTVVGD